MSTIPHRNTVRALVCHASRKSIFTMILGAIGLFAPARAHAQATTFAGLVIENTCKAQVLEPNEKQWHALVSPRGCHRPLVSGEQLKCGSSSGSLTILDSKTYKTISGDQKYVVEISSVLNEVVEYSEPAFTRGEKPPDTIFFSPASEGTIQPEHFVVRWVPPPEIGDVALSVVPKSASKNILYSGHLAGASGALDSQQLRDALAMYRDRGGLDPLVLQLIDAKGDPYSVTFTVLTPPNAKKLTQALAEWDGKDSLVRHLGRSSVYSSFGLYYEAATESELALRESPKSRLLLQLTVNAERRTGNSVRANELETQLSQMTAKVQ